MSSWQSNGRRFHSFPMKPFFFRFLFRRFLLPIPCWGVIGELGALSELKESMRLRRVTSTVKPESSVFFTPAERCLGVVGGVVSKGDFMLPRSACGDGGAKSVRVRLPTPPSIPKNVVRPPLMNPAPHSASALSRGDSFCCVSRRNTGQASAREISSSVSLTNVWP